MNKSSLSSHIILVLGFYPISDSGHGVGGGGSDVKGHRGCTLFTIQQRLFEGAASLYRIVGGERLKCPPEPDPGKASMVQMRGGKGLRDSSVDLKLESIKALFNFF